MDKKQITDYFRGNIFEAYSHYNVWKTLAYSKSYAVVSKEMADRYVEVQGYHNAYFSISERAFLISFVILILHPFDGDKRSYSLHKVDSDRTAEFILQNKDTIDKLYLVRNKIFAHGDMGVTGSTVNNYALPSIEELDKFFKNLIKLYNELSREVDQSSTMFTNAEDMKSDVEALLMNLYRGERVRKQEIEIDWKWKKDSQIISDVI